mmetsp:Transcript_7582/g.12010  ORF Transcript_7582/g.12010 Transcript_7582/m.12010 type:complete len:200 (-) Transcript_7582:632-1231(-)
MVQPGHIGVDVARALVLQELPGLHHLPWQTTPREVAHQGTICLYNLSDLKREVIFPAALVAHAHCWPDAHRRHGNGEHQQPLGIDKAEQLAVLRRDFLQQVVGREWVDILMRLVGKGFKILDAFRHLEGLCKVASDILWRLLGSGTDGVADHQGHARSLLQRRIVDAAVGAGPDLLARLYQALVQRRLLQLINGWAPQA